MIEKYYEQLWLAAQLKDRQEMYAKYAAYQEQIVQDYINKDAEVVGISFDGNIQGLPGNFIYRTEIIRAVGLHSSGMIEVLEKIYYLNRISDELKSGEMVR